MRKAAAFVIAGLMAGPALADRFAAGSSDDPAVREAEFMAADHRYLSALSELASVKPAAPGAEFLRLEADSALNFGLVDQFLNLSASLSTSEADNADYQMRLAEFDYQRGHFEDADKHLGSVPLHSSREGLWTELKSLVLLAQGRSAEAASLLSGSDRPLDRYNLAVAQFDEKKSLNARQTLEKLGRIEVYEPETGALRDKANLVLAYDYLKSGEGKQAVPIFNRIHSVGPYTNKALLGLGWAQLAPDQSDSKTSASASDAESGSIGATAKGSAIDKSGHNGALLDLEPGKGTPAQQAQFKRALVPWLDLISRDPFDSSVQECMLAIPFALDRLGAFTQAQEYYQRAIDGLENTRSRLDESIARVSQGQMIASLARSTSPFDAQSGWSWQLKALPVEPETFYLQSLIADNRFQEALKQYRDVLLLEATLEGWQAKLSGLKSSRVPDASAVAALQSQITDLAPQLAAAKLEATSQVEALAQNELQQQKKMTDRYLVEARLALGRLYDRHIGAGSP